MIARALSLLAIVALLAPAAARAQSAREAAVKADYLVKFGSYVGWPAGEGPVHLCVVGRDVLGRALASAAAGRQIEGRPLVVKSVPAVAPGSGCAVAYLTGSDRQSVSAALAAFGREPVLTVTDSRWSRARGIIHFQVVAGRVRFHIDEQAAATNGLTVSSRLLGLALSVKPRTR